MASEQDIRVVDFNTIKPLIPDKMLADAEVSFDLVHASLKQTPPSSISGVNLTFGAEATLDVAAFNSSDDKDEDGVLIKPSDSRLPAIPFDTQHAWSRYRITGLLSAAVKAKLESVGVGLDASRRFTLSDYRVHDRDERALTAIITDLAAPRTIFHSQDVLDLKPNEALRLAVRGHLAASFEVTWADVFTRSLSAIAQELNTATTIAVKFEAGAKVTFNASVDDDFTLVFSRAVDGRYIVAVKKTTADKATLGVKAGVDVTFADPNAVEKALTQFLTGVLGDRADRIDALLAKATGATLTKEEQEILDKVATRLGLDDGLNQLQALRDKLKELKDKASAVIEKVAKAKVAFAFEFEYARIDTETTLCQAILQASAVTDLHASLVGGNVQPLLEAVRESRPDVELKEFLKEKTQIRRAAYGFSLGLGKWVVSEKDISEFKTVTQTALDDSLRITYTGTRGYEGGQLLTTVKRSIVDFVAKMPDYSPTPRTSDFDFGIGIVVEYNPRELDHDYIDEIIDTATMWRIVAGSVPARDQLAAVQGRRVTAGFHLTFSEEALRQIMADAGTEDRAAIGRAFGAAVPFDHRFKGRSSYLLRQIIYGPLWAEVLRNDQLMTPSAWKSAAVNAVKQVDGNLTNFEQSPNLAAFHRLVEGQSGIVNRWRRFLLGAQLLDKAVNSGTLDSTKIPTIYNDLKGLFDQSLYVRAFGSYLTDIAARNGALTSIDRALRIEFKDDNGKEQVLALAAS